MTIENSNGFRTIETYILCSENIKNTMIRAKRDKLKKIINDNKNILIEKNEHNQTLFDMAFDKIKFNNSSAARLVCKILIKYGYNINTQDQNGNTALHKAILDIEQGERKISFLSKNNANFSIKNNDQQTPIEYGKLNLNLKLSEETSETKNTVQNNVNFLNRKIEKQTINTMKDQDLPQTKIKLGFFGAFRLLFPLY